MYFSLYPDPGYNISYLDSQGIDGEYDLFSGQFVETEDKRTGITWGGRNYSIKGSLTLWSAENSWLYLSQDIWSKSKLDVLDVFEDLEFYYNSEKTKKTNIVYNSFEVNDMIEKNMMIETRPRYPSDTLSFTIANITKDNPIRYLNILLNSSDQFDVYLELKDSQRNFLSSFVWFFM